VLDVLPRVRRAVLPGHLPLELLARGGARPHAQHSLLAEISHSEFKPEDRDTIVEQTLEGMVNTRLLTEADVRDRIADTFVIERDYTYPTPSLERDGVLRAVHPVLHERGIFSRGRFGAWRYEVGNMDHSVAQGVEWANRVVQGAVDDELTYQAKRGC
jgi:UDP-galactopyranose mutase